VCREQGEACFDSASVIPHHRRYFYDMCHFTEAGSRLIGEAVAEFMLSRGLVSGGTSTGAFPVHEGHRAALNHLGCPESLETARSELNSLRRNSLPPRRIRATAR
jgi:hypothetical protein